MGVQKFAKMRDISLNEPVPLTLPAYVWVAFNAWYVSGPNRSESADAVARQVQEEIMDPLYLNEQKAEHQRMHDEQQRAAASMFPGIVPMPDFPSTPEDLQDGNT